MVQQTKSELNPIWAPRSPSCTVSDLASCQCSRESTRGESRCLDFTHVGNLGELAGSWLQTSPAPHTAAMQGENQMETLISVLALSCSLSVSLLLSLRLSNKKINSFFFNEELLVNRSLSKGHEKAYHLEKSKTQNLKWKKDNNLFDNVYQM